MICSFKNLLFCFLSVVLLLGLDGHLEGGESDVVISEIMYNPDTTNTGGEFVEIYNSGPSAVNVGGWQLVDSTQVMFTLTPNTMMGAGEYLVFYDDAAAITFYSLNPASSYGPYTGGLSGDGESIQLKNPGQVVMDEVTYDDNWPWPPQPDGDGPSLELIDPAGDNNDSSNWGIGQLYSPGQANNPTFWGEGDIIISELMYHPGSTNWGGEYIELYNRSGSAIDLAGWTLEQGISYTITGTMVLGAGEYLVIAGDPNVVSYYHLESLRVLGPYERDLGNGGDLVVLRNAAAAVVTVVNYNDQAPWPTEADGFGPSLELLDVNGDNNNPANWGIGQPCTPAAANAPAVSGDGDIVITEIMYQPVKYRYMHTLNWLSGNPYYWKDGDDSAGQYVELFNRGSETIALAGWQLQDEEGILYTFTSGASLAPNHYLVICQNAAAIASRYGISNGTGDFNPACNGLAGDGERLTLLNNNGAIVDAVQYNDEPPWPIGPDQTGVSLECISPLFDNNKPENWRSCTVAEPEAPFNPAVGGEYFLNRGTPGTANSRSLTLVPSFVEVDTLKHSPKRITSSDTVTITAVVTGDHPITGVTLDYEVFVAPYQTATVTDSIAMYDDGQHGDDLPGDGKYGVVLSERNSQTLVRYRVTVTDSMGSWTYPDACEPNPNRAYFVYNGEEETNLPAYFLIAPQSTLNALAANIWTRVFYDAALVVDGVVYDHVGIHYHGQGWRNFPKHGWKIQFNKTEYLRDLRQLDMPMHLPVMQKLVHDIFWSIGQGNIACEPVRLYRNGVFWGLYLAQEPPNNSWLKKHHLDDAGEVFKASCLANIGAWPNVNPLDPIADLDYYANHSLYPGMYEKKGDALGSFDSLIDLCDQVANTPEAAIFDTFSENVELDNWLYKWAVQVIGGHGDIVGNNFMVINPEESGLKWQLRLYDFDHFFGCVAHNVGSANICPVYNKDPYFSYNRWQQRVFTNPQLENRFLVILEDVLRNYLTVDKFNAMLDEAYEYTQVDRMDEMVIRSEWNASPGPYVMDAGDLAAIKNYFASRHSWLLHTWLAGKSYTPPANRHPMITLSNPVWASNGIEISWQFSDPENDACTVDLFWTDKKWSHLEPIPDANDIPAENGSFLWRNDYPEEGDIYIHAIIRDPVSDLVGHGQSVKPIMILRDCQDIWDSGYGLPGDFSRDCMVDTADVSEFVSQWLVCNDPENPDDCNMISPYSFTRTAYEDFDVTHPGGGVNEWQYGYYETNSSSTYTKYNWLGDSTLWGGPTTNIIHGRDGTGDPYGSIHCNIGEAIDRPAWPSGMYWNAYSVTMQTMNSRSPALRWTAPGDGVYQVDMVFEHNSQNAGVITGVQVLLNRSVAASGTISGFQSGPENFFTYSQTLSLSAGDYVEAAIDGPVRNNWSRVAVSVTIETQAYEVTCADVNEYYEKDLNYDCYINLLDFYIIVSNWLSCNDPENPECAIVF